MYDYNIISFLYGVDDCASITRHHCFRKRPGTIWYNVFFGGKSIIIILLHAMLNRDWIDYIQIKITMTLYGLFASTKRDEQNKFVQINLFGYPSKLGYSNKLSVYRCIIVFTINVILTHVFKILSPRVSLVWVIFAIPKRGRLQFFYDYRNVVLFKK